MNIPLVIRVQTAFTSSSLSFNIHPKIVSFARRTPTIQIRIENETASTSASSKTRRKRKREVGESKKVIRKLKRGEDVERDDKQEKEFQELKTLLNALGNSVALNETTVKCGICLKQHLMEGDRKNTAKVSYFKRKHFDECSRRANLQTISAKETERMKSAMSVWLKSSANTQPDPDSDVDPDLIIENDEDRLS